MAPRAVPSSRARRARPPTRGRSSSSPSRASRSRSRPGQFTMLYAFGVGEVPISVSGRRRTGRSCTPSARSARSPQAICAAEPGAVLGVRGPFGTRWPVEHGDGRRRRRRRRRRSASRRCGRSLYHVARAPRATTARSSLLYGAARPPTCSTARSSSAGARADLEVDVTVDAADRRLARQGRRRAEARSPRRRFDPARDRRVRLRARGHDALRGARRCSSAASPPERIYVSLERNMQCGVGHCGHCQLGPTLICRDGPVYRYDDARAAGWGCGSCERDEAEARRLEVRLVRRLPAHAARLRGRAARARRRGRDRLLPRGDDAPTVDGPVRPLARRGLDHDRRTTPSASSEVRRVVEDAGHDRRLRDRRRHPGAAQLRRRRGVRLDSSTRRPSTSRRSRPRRRSPTTSRSTSSCAAARSTSASCSR